MTKPNEATIKQTVYLTPNIHNQVELYAVNHNLSLSNAVQELIAKGAGIEVEHEYGEDQPFADVVRRPIDVNNSILPVTGGDDITAELTAAIARVNKSVNDFMDGKSNSVYL